MRTHCFLPWMFVINWGEVPLNDMTTTETATASRSCLYECDVMHYRLEPKKHRFLYKIFMFCLDLDEMEALAQKLRLFSLNQFNLFAFRDSDHMEPARRTLKENIIEFAGAHGMNLRGGRVLLVTHLRTLGYIFNPVCVYFCFDPSGAPACAVVEVENTYHEKKRYWLGPETFRNGIFELRATKYFYVSPFIQPNAEFDFKLSPPDQSLSIYIDDWIDGRKFLLSSLTGKRQRLSDANLLWHTLRFPFVTLQVIFLIHWQALILKLKGLRHFKKSDNPHLQQEIYHARHHA